MAIENKRENREALAIIAAGGAGALIASLLNRRPDPGATPVEIPPELLSAIAVLVANSDTTVQQLSEILTTLGISGVGQNPDEMFVFTIFPPIINVAVQFPEQLVGYDKDLVIRAYPVNAGNMYVGNTAAEAMNPNSSWLLQPNDIVGWKIHNTKQLWASCTVVGDGIMVTGERRP
jgi:hypothetical protein